MLGCKTLNSSAILDFSCHSLQKWHSSSRHQPPTKKNKNGHKKKGHQKNSTRKQAYVSMSTSSAKLLNCPLSFQKCARASRSLPRPQSNRWPFLSPRVLTCKSLYMIPKGSATCRKRIGYSAPCSRAPGNLPRSGEGGGGRYGIQIEPSRLACRRV